MSANEQALSHEDAAEILLKIADLLDRAILIGGQSVNFYASIFSAHENEPICAR